MPVCISARLFFWFFFLTTTFCSDNTNLSQAFNCTITFPPVNIGNVPRACSFLCFLCSFPEKKVFSGKECVKYLFITFIYVLLCLESRCKSC